MTKYREIFPEEVGPLLEGYSLTFASDNETVFRFRSVDHRVALERQLLNLIRNLWASKLRSGLL